MLTNGRFVTKFDNMLQFFLSPLISSTQMSKHCEPNSRVFYIPDTELIKGTNEIPCYVQFHFHHVLHTERELYYLRP